MTFSRMIIYKGMIGLHYNKIYFNYKLYKMSVFNAIVFN